MKHFLFLFLLLTTSALALAQYPLAEGKSQLNAGFGFSNWGLPIYLGFDHGIHRDISVGLEGSFRNYREHWKENRYNHTIIGITGNGNYHFNRLFEMDSSPWDVYAGLSIGFFIWSSPNNYPGSRASGLGLSGQAGARYYFSSKAAINLELGGGSLSGGKIGITVFL